VPLRKPGATVKPASDAERLYASIEKISGDKIKQTVEVKNGVDSEQAKKIVKLIKDNKLKVQASIQGTAVRVSGRQEGRLAGCDPARQEIRHRDPAAVPEFSRLTATALKFRFLVH
jgi:Protein of unknown function (DUF520)